MGWHDNVVHALAFELALPFPGQLLVGSRRTRLEQRRIVYALRKQEDHQRPMIDNALTAAKLPAAWLAGAAQRELDRRIAMGGAETPCHRTSCKGSRLISKPMA